MLVGIIIHNTSFCLAQQNTRITYEIDSLVTARKILQKMQDSIALVIEKQNKLIADLEVALIQNNSKIRVYPAVIADGFCSKWGSIYFEKGEEILVVGYSGGEWKVIYNDREFTLFDRCISFVDKTLNIEALRAKFISEENANAEEDQRKQDSIEAEKQAIIDSLLLVVRKPLDAQGRTNYPFRINKVVVTDINSADGVDFMISGQYLKTDKTIKYLYFTVVPYNAVGDRVQCNLRGNSEFTGKITGPIKASYDNQEWYWETAWYNSTVVCLKLVKVEVEYMDGSSYTYVNELYRILGDFKNKCVN